MPGMRKNNLEDKFKIIVGNRNEKLKTDGFKVIRTIDLVSEEGTDNEVDIDGKKKSK